MVSNVTIFANYYRLWRSWGHYFVLIHIYGLFDQECDKGPELGHIQGQFTLSKTHQISISHYDLYHRENNVIFLISCHDQIRDPSNPLSNVNPFANSTCPNPLLDRAQNYLWDWITVLGHITCNYGIPSSTAPNNLKTPKKVKYIPPLYSINYLKVLWNWNIVDFYHNFF